MRVISKNHVFEIRDAWCNGKRLVFKDLDNRTCRTKDYPTEDDAMDALCDLTIKGYIMVNEWY